MSISDRCRQAIVQHLLKHNRRWISCRCPGCYKVLRRSTGTSVNRTNEFGGTLMIRFISFHCRFSRPMAYRIEFVNAAEVSYWSSIYSSKNVEEPKRYYERRFRLAISIYRLSRVSLQMPRLVLMNMIRHFSLTSIIVSYVTKFSVARNNWGYILLIISIRLTKITVLQKIWLLLPKIVTNPAYL